MRRPAESRHRPRRGEAVAPSSEDGHRADCLRDRPCPGYHWSTVLLRNTIEARAFCASLAAEHELHLGEPSYCSHMIEANDEFD
jgi:hypothetical protein